MYGVYSMFAVRDAALVIHPTLDGAIIRTVLVFVLMLKRSLYVRIE